MEICLYLEKMIRFMKKINHCYNENFSGGIGDFFKGSIYLYYWCLENNVEFTFNFHNHPVDNYLTSKFHYTDLPILDIESQPHLGKNLPWNQALQEKLFKIINSEYSEINISSFYHTVCEHPGKQRAFLNSYSIDQECCNFFKNNISFSDSVVKDTKEYIRSIPNYNIMHFRLGDGHTLEQNLKNVELPKNVQNNLNFFKFEQNFEKYVEIIEAEKKDNTILISDSNDFKKYVKEQKLKDVHILHEKSVHLCTKPSLLMFTDYQVKRSELNIYYTCMDLLLLSMSQNNTIYSFYPWGSGFSYWVSKIFNVPVRIKKLEAPRKEY